MRAARPGGRAESSEPIELLNPIDPTQAVEKPSKVFFMKDKTWTKHSRDVTLVVSSVAARW